MDNSERNHQHLLLAVAKLGNRSNQKFSFRISVPVLVYLAPVHCTSTQVGHVDRQELT
jgi:hypothetical protein